ncbi:hypothetical protein ScPMuIL_005305 [Solemya velum]
MATEEHMVPTMPKSTDVDRGLLDTFGKLAENTEADRIQYTSRLVDLIRTKQGSSEELCGDFQYSVHRLVKGLASGRESARQGFSVALCQLLKEFPALPVAFVIQSIEKYLKVEGNSTRTEVTQVVLGKIFGCLAIIQSRRLKQKENSKCLTGVVKMLQELDRESSHLKLLAVKGIVQVVDQVSEKKFRKRLWPLLKDSLTGGWKNCDPEQLYLLLVCENKYPSLIDGEFLKTYWHNEQLVDSRNFTFLNDVLLHASPGHLVYEAIVRSVVACGLSLTDFWTGVVKSFFESTAEKKRTGLHLFLSLLPHIKSTEQMTGSSKTKKRLKSLCLHTANELVNFVEDETDGEMQLCVLRCLLTRPGSPQFDLKTRSNTVRSVIQKLGADGVVRFSKDLIAIVDGENIYRCEGQSDLERCRQMAVTSLRLLVTHPNIGMDSSCQQDILRTLCRLALFVNKTQSTAGSASQNRMAALHCRENFNKALNNLATFIPELKGRVKCLHSYVKALYRLLHYAQKQYEKPGDMVPRTELADNVKMELKKLLERVDAIHQELPDNSPFGENQAFEILFLYLGFELLTNSSDTFDILRDLHVCYKKALKNKRKCSESSGKEPQWIEVITEILVSLMSNTSHYARVMARTVMGAIAPHITRGALATILDVLDPAKEADQEMIDFEEEVEEDIEEEEPGAGAMETDESESSESSDSDSDGEDGGQPVDEKLQQTVKSALGKAAAKESDDDDLPDLSDSEMFALDDALADAFRSLSKGKRDKDAKERKKQIITFKLRILDMIPPLLKGQPSSGTVVDLIFPLLNLMNNGQKVKEEKQLGDKATAIFRSLFKLKKIPAAPKSDRNRLFLMIEDLIQFSTKVPNTPMVVEVSTACLLVIKLLLGIEGTPAKGKDSQSPEKRDAKKQNFKKKTVEKVSDSLLDCLSRKDHKLNPRFFHILLKRLPLVFWPLSKCLLSTIQNKENRIYCRTLASEMLSILLTNITRDAIGEEEWGAFAGTFSPLAHQVFMKINPERLKQRFIHNFFLLVIRYLTLGDTECKKELLTEKVLQKLETIKGHLNTDCRRACNRITGIAGTVFKISGKLQRKRERMDELSPTEECTTGGVTASKLAKLENVQDTGMEQGDKDIKKKKKKKKKKIEKNQDGLIDGIADNEMKGKKNKMIDQACQQTDKTKEKKRHNNKEMKKADKRKKKMKLEGDSQQVEEQRETETEPAETADVESATELVVKKKKKRKLEETSQAGPHIIKCFVGSSSEKKEKKKKMEKDISPLNAGECTEKKTDRKDNETCSEEDLSSEPVHSDADQLLKKLKTKEKKKLSKTVKEDLAALKYHNTSTKKLWVNGANDTIGVDPDISLGGRFMTGSSSDNSAHTDHGSHHSLVVDLEEDCEADSTLEYKLKVDSDPDVSQDIQLRKDSEGDITLTIPDDIGSDEDEIECPILISEDSDDVIEISNPSTMSSSKSAKKNKSIGKVKENNSTFTKDSVSETDGDGSVDLFVVEKSPSRTGAPLVSAGGLIADNSQIEAKLGNLTTPICAESPQKLNRSTKKRGRKSSRIDVDESTGCYEVADSSPPNIFRSPEKFLKHDVSKSPSADCKGNSPVTSSSKFKETLAVSADPNVMSTSFSSPKSRKKLRTSSEMIIKKKTLGGSLVDFVENSASSGDGTDNTVTILQSLASPRMSADEVSIESAYTPPLSPKKGDNPTADTTLEEVDDEVTLNFHRRESKSPSSISYLCVTPSGGSPARARLSSASPPHTTPSSGSPARARPFGTSPAHVTPSGAIPARARLSGASPAHTTPSSGSPAQARPSGASPANVTPSSGSPARARPSGASPARVRPSGVRPSGATPPRVIPLDVSSPQRTRGVGTPLLNEASTLTQLTEVSQSGILSPSPKLKWMRSDKKKKCKSVESFTTTKLEEIVLSSPDTSERSCKYLKHEPAQADLKVLSSDNQEKSDSVEEILVSPKNVRVTRSRKSVTTSKAAVGMETEKVITAMNTRKRANSEIVVSTSPGDKKPERTKSLTSAVEGSTPGAAVGVETEKVITTRKRANSETVALSPKDKLSKKNNNVSKTPYSLRTRSRKVAA